MFLFTLIFVYVNLIKVTSKNPFCVDFEQKFRRTKKAGEARLCALRGDLTQLGKFLPEGVFRGSLNSFIFFPKGDTLMKAVLTVVGKDTVGILAKVSGECAKYNVNINDVSQTIQQEMFCMIMMCDITNISIDFGAFSDNMSKIGKEMNMAIHVMHEDIFNSMHRI